MPRSEDSSGRQPPSTTFGQARNKRKGQEAEYQAHLHPFQSSRLPSPAADFSGFLPVIYAGIKAAKAAPAVFIPPPKKQAALHLGESTRAGTQAAGLGAGWLGAEQLQGQDDGNGLGLPQGHADMQTTIGAVH